MIEIIRSALELALAPAAIIAAGGFLARHFIEHARQRDISNRQADRDAELELVRKKLSDESFSFQKSEGHLIERRSEAIAELRALISEMNENILRLVQPLQMGYVDKEKERERKNTLYKNAVDSYSLFQKSVERYDVYLPEKLDDRISNLLDTAKNVIITYQTAYYDQEKPDYKALMEAYKSMKDEAAPIIKDLKSEFRSILGVHERA